MLTLVTVVGQSPQTPYPANETVIGGQTAQPDWPGRATCPAGHEVQLWPGMLFEPAGQAVHVIAPGIALKKPAGQIVQIPVVVLMKLFTGHGDELGDGEAPNDKLDDGVAVEVNEDVGEGLGVTEGVGLDATTLLGALAMPRTSTSAGISMRDFMRSVMTQFGETTPPPPPPVAVMQFVEIVNKPDLPTFVGPPRSFATKISIDSSLDKIIPWQSYEIPAAPPTVLTMLTGKAGGLLLM